MKSSEQFHSLAKSDTVSRLLSIVHEHSARADACQTLTFSAAIPQTADLDIEILFALDLISFLCAALSTRVILAVVINWHCQNSISESWGCGLGPSPG